MKMFLEIKSFVSCRTWPWLRFMHRKTTNNGDCLRIKETEVKNATHKVGSLV